MNGERTFKMAWNKINHPEMLQVYSVGFEQIKGQDRMFHRTSDLRSV